MNQKPQTVQHSHERPPVNGASTFGWDTTFTASYEIVNKEIREKSTYPATFDNTTDAYELLNYLSGANTESYYQLFKASLGNDESVTLKGSWGQWQLELRGNGNSIYIKLPVKSGTIALGETEGSLDGGYIIAEVALRFESQQTGTKTETGTEDRSLVLSDPGSSQVSVVDHSFPGLDAEGILDLLVEGVFKKYLNTDKVLDQFRYVFSTVSVNDKATGDFAWLKPSDTGYAVFVPGSQPTEADSLFSILCMTDNTTAPSYLQQSVDASVFQGRTEDANAVLCVSPQKFCANVLITAATKMITGTTSDDYSYSTDGMELHNVNDIVFKNVKVSDSDTVDLSISTNNFSIRVVNDHLELEMINASYSETMYNAYLTLHQRIEFETKKEGDNKTIFVLKEGDEFKGELNVVVEPSATAQILKWVGVALDILSAVLLIGAGTAKVLAKCATTATSASATIANATVSSAEAATATAAATEGIAAGAGASRGMTIATKLLTASSVCTVMGLPLTLVEAIAVEMGNGKFDNVPSLEDFADNFLSEIAWTGIEDTTLLGARLNDALLLDFKLE